MTTSPLPVIAHWYYIAFTVISLSLNVLLIGLIWKKSPKSFGIYKFLLLNTSTNQVILIVFSFILQLRLIFSESSVALLPYGPIRRLSSEVVFIAYNVYNVFLCTTNFSILLSMYYRYALICHGKVNPSNLAKILAFSWATLFAMTIAILIPPFEFSIVIQNTISSYPSYKLLQTYGAFGGFKSTDDLIYQVNTTILLTIFPALLPIFTFYWRRHIFRQINEVEQHLSAKTKKFSLDLVRALTLQATFPMVFLIPNAVYFTCSQKMHIEFQTAEFFAHPSCIIPCLIDPILTVIYATPYRDFVTKLFTKVGNDRKKYIEPFSLSIRIISSGISVALLVYGLLRHASLEISFVTYNVYNLFLCTTNFSILLSMYYRYVLICHGKCENKDYIRIFGVSWLIPLMMTIAIIIPPYDFPTVIENTKNAYWKSAALWNRTTQDARSQFLSWLCKAKSKKKKE